MLYTVVLGIAVVDGDDVEACIIAKPLRADIVVRCDNHIAPLDLVYRLYRLAEALRPPCLDLYKDQIIALLGNDVNLLVQIPPVEGVYDVALAL